MTTKPNPFLISISLIIFLTGCIKMAQKKYHLGRNFGSIRQNEYFLQISKENNFDAAELLYLDSASYISFGQHSSGSLYYGSYINDSVSIRKSVFLLENESCMGRMDKEIEKIIFSSRPDTLIKDTLNALGKCNFLRLADDKKVELFNKDKKLTIVLVYFFAYGSYYKSLYEEIKEFKKKHENDCDVYVVSMDPVYMNQRRK